MSDFITSFVKTNKPQFLKYKNYIKNNDWTKKIIGNEDSDKDRWNEFPLQNELIVSILDRLKYFTTKASADSKLLKYKTFVKDCLDIIEIHTSRVDLYVNSVDISDINDVSIRTSEVKFLKECFSKVTKIQDTLSSLNINLDDAAENIGIAFYEDRTAPLSMHHILVEKYPEIQDKLDAMGIDFESMPKNEMLVNIKDAPVWNIKKHYFDQDKETLQFYVDEFKKIRQGIIIDGVYISPWMYYHLNVFKATIPTEVYDKVSKKYSSKDLIINPPLRDNEWFIIQDNYLKAKDEGKMLFIAATRRAAKTTLITSHLDHSATIGLKTLLCAGGSAKDLGQIESNFKTTIQNKNPAFATYNLSNDWTKKIYMGIKTKAGETLPLSTLSIVNLDSGGDKKSEVLAGYTPDAFVLDEAMKVSFASQLEALKPALDTPYGKRCVPIIASTAGNEELAQDGYNILDNPVIHKVLNMEWDALERGIDKKFITWKRRDFGTFIPGQMSSKDGLRKINTTLADYLGMPEANGLKEIGIQVTDWEKALEIITKDRENKKKDKKAYVKELLYHPIDPEELYISMKINPFPVEEAKMHLKKIRDNEQNGKKVEVYRDGIDIKYSLSNRPLPDFPFKKGGFHDSPVVLFEDIPTAKPNRFLYVAALDDYKQEQADSDSLGCFYIYKRQSGNDPMGDRIVAAYTSRPNPHNKFHRIGYMLLEAFNAECLMENEDMEFKTYLDSLHKTEEYLVSSFNMEGDITIKSNNRRSYGISPNGNKSAILNKVINYCNKPVDIPQQDGSVKSCLGIELIDDEMLLEELISYKDGNNHDRITTFGIALIQAHYLDTNYIEARNGRKEEVKKETVREKSNILGVSRRTRLF